MRLETNEDRSWTETARLEEGPHSWAQKFSALRQHVWGEGLGQRLGLEPTSQVRVTQEGHHSAGTKEGEGEFGEKTASHNQGV